MNETEECDIRIRPITMGQYYRMLEVDIIDERERVELLDGQLISMGSEEPLHASVVTALNELLIIEFAARAMVRPRLPIELDELSVPRPDLTLVRRRADWYTLHDPRPDDVFLIVEVSRSTLAYDCRRKLGAYARGGICEVWIVNLVHGQVEAYSEPREAGYATRVIVDRDGALAPRAFPDDVISVASFLP